jgi:hypothetical protein
LLRSELEVQVGTWGDKETDTSSPSFSSLVLLGCHRSFPILGILTKENGH